MADERPYDGISRAFGASLHHRAKVTESFAFAQLVNSLGQRLFGNFHQPSSFLAYASDSDGIRRIAVKAVVNNTVIQPDDIAFAQRPIRRNPMDALFIHRRAQTTGIDPASNVISFERW